MEVQIHSVHFTADSKLEEYINKKISKLSTFYDRIVRTEIYLRLEGGDSAVREKVVEVKLDVPGNTLFAKESASKFEPAVDKVIDQLRRQLKRHKDKQQSH
jgi:putative sigma-54 modulation protein